MVGKKPVSDIYWDVSPPVRSAKLKIVIYELANEQNCQFGHFHHSNIKFFMYYVLRTCVAIMVCGYSQGVAASFQGEGERWGQVPPTSPQMKPCRCVYL